VEVLEMEVVEVVEVEVVVLEMEVVVLEVEVVVLEVEVVVLEVEVVVLEVEVVEVEVIEWIELILMRRGCCVIIEEVGCLPLPLNV